MERKIHAGKRNGRASSGYNVSAAICRSMVIEINGSCWEQSSIGQSAADAWQALMGERTSCCRRLLELFAVLACGKGTYGLVMKLVM